MSDKQFNFFKKVFSLIHEFVNYNDYSLESFTYEPDALYDILIFLSTYQVDLDEVEFFVSSYILTFNNEKTNDYDQINQLKKEDIVIPNKKDFNGTIEFRATSIVTEFYEKNCYLPSRFQLDLENYSIDTTDVKQEFLDTWDHETRIEERD